MTPGAMCSSRHGQCLPLAAAIDGKVLYLITTAKQPSRNKAAGISRKYWCGRDIKNMQGSGLELIRWEGEMNIKKQTDVRGIQSKAG